MGCADGQTRRWAGRHGHVIADAFRNPVRAGSLASRPATPLGGKPMIHLTRRQTLVALAAAAASAAARTPAEAAAQTGRPAPA